MLARRRKHGTLQLASVAEPVALDGITAIKEN